MLGSFCGPGGGKKKKMFAVLAFLLFVTAPATATATKTVSVTAASIVKEIFVNPEGQSGDRVGSVPIFKSIKDAIDEGVPKNNTGWVLIHLAPSFYRECLVIPVDKPYIYLKGHSRSTTTVACTTSGGTLLEATLTVLPHHFIAQHITFLNTYNLDEQGRLLQNDVKPALAASVQGDKIAFYECGFIGVQDTLHDVTGRHFFKSCYIQGAVDFIFGDGTSIYLDCVINASGYGYISAQSRASPLDRSGFVFKYCVINGVGPTFLGRAYGPFSRVVYYMSSLSGIVNPSGWDSWLSVGHEGRLTYAEVGCFGEGANTTQRVRWSNKVSRSELKNLISTSFIDRGRERWVERQPLTP